MDKTPQLFWDWGTAYEFFVSMWVLHQPADFGLRPAWAAGMRSRLPNEERETLEAIQKSLLGSPFHWVYALPQPKDSRTLLRALAGIPAAERLPSLFFGPEFDPAWQEVLEQVARRGSWDEASVEAMRKNEQQKGPGGKKAEMYRQTLALWIDLEGWGQRMLRAYQAYYEVFFAEEENRIRPALQQALERAQALAEKAEFPDLIEDLSQGLRIEEKFEHPEVLLAPSYWSTPLIVFSKVSEQRQLLLFGARPADASLVPGEVVPEALLRSLKALSDPTRLRILRYLASESLTPTQLARRLRLRTPTVIHHLDNLRLAALVQLRLGQGKNDKDKRYATRIENVAETFKALEHFLTQEELDPLPAFEPAEEEALT